MVRPFSQSAQVHCRGYSLPLQRVITDFGADVSFGRIPEKLQEHHGIDVPISSAQGITQTHAQKVHEAQVLIGAIQEQEGVKQLIAQIDGTMIPIVETKKGVDKAGEAIDSRKTRQTYYKEARLVLVDSREQKQPRFGATFGTVEQVGKQLLDCAMRAGMGTNTQVHGVGDGATWIARQMDSVFGAQASYLLDFYHLSEYLADASIICAPSSAKAWLKSQQDLLKHNQSDQVLAALRPHLEPAHIPDEKARVRAAYRYMENRPNQLDYQAAINSGLPIGSGEIESAHRYVILERLDIAGAWWTLNKAEQLLSLRVLRENQEWDDYWSELMPHNA